jgi:tetraacyldisaccharide 4'-kinase
LQENWHAIISGETKGAAAGLAMFGLKAAAALHGFGLSTSLRFYERSIRRRTIPALPVVSIGNLTLGGTGKTTATAFVARQLLTRGKPGVVLSGYRRQSGASPLIVSDGEQLRAGLAEAGDEAYMLALQLPGCAVAVGKRREDVIDALRTQAGAEIAVLDDGFQYFRMARDLDIVLVDALADGMADRLFPAGRLREPMAHMGRAHQVWVTHADLCGPETVARLKRTIAAHCDGRPPIVTRHHQSSLRALRADDEAPQCLAGQRVLALSALGNPLAFELGLRQLGCEVVSLSFPDHHDYSLEDYRRIVPAARAVGAEMIVTTEKDAVKLPAPPADCPPVVVQGCELQIMEGEDSLLSGLHAVFAGGACAAKGG